MSSVTFQVVCAKSEEIPSRRLGDITFMRVPPENTTPLATAAVVAWRPE